jgi:hypothetical protein
MESDPDDYRDQIEAWMERMGEETADGNEAL